MVAASGPKIRASAGSPGRAWRPARRRCGAARRERPPAAVAVRRRWQVLRRRYRRGAGEPVDIGHGAAQPARQQQRGDGEVLVVIDGHGPVLRSGGAGPSGAVPGLCPANIYAGPHVLALIVVIPAHSPVGTIGYISPRCAGICLGADGRRRKGRVFASRRPDRGCRGSGSAGPRAAPLGKRRRRLGDILPLLRISPSCRVPYPPPFPFPRLPTTWPRCAATWIRRPRRPRACRRPSGPSSRPMPTATASNRRWRGSPRRRGWRCWT